MLAPLCGIETELNSISFFSESKGLDKHKISPDTG